MKKIGIIGAMENEVADLKKATKNIKTTKKAGMEFYEGVLEGSPVVIVRSGLGKVNAAICAQILVDQFQVNAIINTGMGGSLHDKLKIDDIVISTDVLYHDMDAVGFGYKLGQVPQMEVFSFVADKKLATLAKKICLEVNPEVQVMSGRILSGDKFIADQSTKTWLVEQFGGICTEMEGAAIAHTAYLNDVPFVIIRAIADNADCSIDEHHQNFQAEAAKHCVRLIKNLLQQYN